MAENITEQDEVPSLKKDETVIWKAPFTPREEGWTKSGEGGSFVMKDGTLVWVEHEQQQQQSVGKEIILGDLADWNNFSAWFDTEGKGEEDDKEKKERVALVNLAEPRREKVEFWEDGDHPLEEWVEMVDCAFNDVVPDELMKRAHALLSSSASKTDEVDGCIAELRKIYIGRIEMEKSFFKGKFKRECDYISPQAEEFIGEQFRVRGSRGGIAIATHVKDDQGIRLKLREVRKLAKQDKDNLLAAKIKKRMKDAGSKEELQALLDFVRTIEGDQTSQREEDKADFENRKKSWISEIEELLRSEDIPDEPAVDNKKDKRIIKGNYLPAVKLLSWHNAPPKVNKQALKDTMLRNNQADGVKLRPGELTPEQQFTLVSTEICMSVHKSALMTEEEQKESQSDESLSLHRIHALMDAHIPARLVERTISCTKTPNRPWKFTHINVNLPVTIGISDVWEDGRQDVVVSEIGKISVYDAARLQRYNSGKKALKCTESYLVDKKVKIVHAQVTKTHIGLLALCPDAVYQVVFVLNRATGHVYGFTTKMCPMTTFLLDEDGVHVWLGFNHGLLIKVEIASRKRREQYWIGEEAPIQVICARKNRVIASTHKGVVLFNNGPGYENTKKRIIMPIGPVIDMRFHGNLYVVHRPDNSLEILNLFTGDLEAFIPKPSQFETNEANTPYNSITLTEDHMAITFPEGNTLHFYV